MKHKLDEGKLDLKDRQEDERSEIDFLYDIGSHMAAADPLDEALSGVVSFSKFLVNCDSCFVYVREAERFVLWVWKNSGHEVVETLEASDEIVERLATQRSPVAVSRDPQPGSRLIVFEEWSQKSGETYVAVPLLSRGKRLGVIALRHHQPHVYSRRDVQARSSVAFLLR